VWKVYNIATGKIVKAGFESDDLAKEWLERRKDLPEDEYDIDEMDEEEEEEFLENESDDDEAGEYEPEYDEDGDVRDVNYPDDDLGDTDDLGEDEDDDRLVDREMNCRYPRLFPSLGFWLLIFVLSISILKNRF